MIDYNYRIEPDTYRAGMIRGQNRIPIQTVACLAVVAIAVSAYTVFGPVDEIIGAVAVALLASAPAVVRTWKSILGLSIACLAVTAIPLCGSVYFGSNLIRPNLIRSYFLVEPYTRAALFLVLVQCLSMAAFAHSAGNSAVNVTWKAFSGRGHRYSLMAVITALSFLSNPSRLIFGGDYGSDDYFRQSALIGGWPLLFVVAFSYYVFRYRFAGHGDLLFTAAIVLVWLLHGNRGEVFVILWLVAVFRITAAQTVRARAVVVAAVLAGVVLFQIVGVLRSAGPDLGQALLSMLSGESSLFLVPGQGLREATFAPAAYALVATIGLIDVGVFRYRWGVSFAEYLLRTLPASWDVPWERPSDLAQELILRASTIGGSHFGSEPYWNFGVFGAAAYAALYAVFLLYVGRRAQGSAFYGVLALSLAILAPRIMWYGNIYLYKLLILMGVIWLARKSTRAMIAEFGSRSGVSD
jgi:hypothetical protein